MALHLKHPLLSPKCKKRDLPPAPGLDRGQITEDLARGNSNRLPVRLVLSPR